MCHIWSFFEKLIWEEFKNQNQGAVIHSKINQDIINQDIQRDKPRYSRTKTKPDIKWLKNQLIDDLGLTEKQVSSAIESIPGEKLDIRAVLDFCFK